MKIFFHMYSFVSYGMAWYMEVCISDIRWGSGLKIICLLYTNAGRKRQLRVWLNWCSEFDPCGLSLL